MSKTKSKKKNIWFVKVRGSYIPCSWQGWATYVPFTLYLLSVLQFAARIDRSASDVVYVVFPQFVCAGIVMTWIAAKTSR